MKKETKEITTSVARNLADFMDAQLIRMKEYIETFKPESLGDDDIRNEYIFVLSIYDNWKNFSKGMRTGADKLEEIAQNQEVKKDDEKETIGFLGNFKKAA